MAGKVSLTVRDELRDMITTTVVREAVTSKSVTIVREVLFRESNKTILYKVKSSHFVFLQNCFIASYIIYYNMFWTKSKPTKYTKFKNFFCAILSVYTINLFYYNNLKSS
jgi:hypothetical protein